MLAWSALETSFLDRPTLPPANKAVVHEGGEVHKCRVGEIESVYVYFLFVLKSCHSVKQDNNRD